MLARIAPHIDGLNALVEASGECLEGRLLYMHQHSPGPLVCNPKKRLKQRKEKAAAFEHFLRVKAQEYAEMRPKRIELRGGVESDDEDNYTFVEEEEREEIEMVEEIEDDGEEIEIGDD